MKLFDPEAVELDVTAILQRVPTEDWYHFRNCVKDANEISNIAFDLTRDQITGTAAHKVVHSCGTSAAYSIQGNHTQTFLQTDFHKYEVYQTKHKHPQHNILPIIVAMTRLDTAERKCYAIAAKPEQLYSTR